MEMASFFIKIRHFFDDTSLTERSIVAGPPVIIQLSGVFPQQEGRSGNQVGRHDFELQKS